MTAATLSVENPPGRRAWHALIWLVPLTALWIAFNFVFPGFGASGVPIVTSRLAIHVMIALGLWLGLERAELTPSQLVEERLVGMLKSSSLPVSRVQRVSKPGPR